MAKEIGISRSVVVSAYEQLAAEGYLEGRVGSGTFVVEGAAGGDSFSAAAMGDSEPSTGDSARRLIRIARRQKISSARQLFHHSLQGQDIIDFDGACACSEPGLFPKEEWSLCLSRAARGNAGRRLYSGGSVLQEGSGYGFGEAAGDRALRRAIADYLFRMKGMSCGEDEIIVTSGSSQAALLLGVFLRDRWDSVQVEDPTYPPLRATLKRLGLRLHPLAVDGAGLRPESMDGGLPLLATPAHHFPTGARMPAERREAIAARLRSGGGIAIEDDYDGELRLRGLPIRPLRALAPDNVALMGSFSKCMYPGLRLGYLVVPEGLVDRLLGIKFALALWADGLAQAALARFIDEGRLDRRIRRIKRDCADKRALVEELAAGLPAGREGGKVRVVGEGCGMHCALSFEEGLPADFRRSATVRAGFVASPHSAFSILPDSEEEAAILVGYGALSPGRIREGFARMAAHIESARKPG